MENSAVAIFFSFLSKDRDFYQQIQAHLSLLERQKQIHCSSSGDIFPGEERIKERKLLERAQIIALLISPAYLRSDEHYLELELAMQRYQAGQAHVLPILLTPGDYKDAPFAGLQVLPHNGTPISQWYEKSDEAYQEIAAEIRKLLQKFTLQTASEQNATLWTVPYPRNTLFTGREEELAAIEAALRQGKNAAVSAISGLGGIGKTQIALEYAYRHRQEYRYVFWVLADTRDTLNAHYSQIAERLNLPGKNQPELHYIVVAVKSWLEKNAGWLLILDNADDLTIISDFLPASTAPGHILLTTRSQALGRLAERIEARKLDIEEGAAFLLSRCGLHKRNTPAVSIDPKELEAARQVVRELDGLPLALDQAGAYIEETSCGLQGYLTLYRKEHKELLKTRGGLVEDHPASVAQTVQIAFKKIEKSNPAAADLLRFCAFLAPEDIPELLIEKGEAEFPGPLKQLSRKPLKLNAAIADLQKYSLISRNAPTKTLEVHRLVQVVLKDNMTKNVEQAWATRVVRVMSHVFPWPKDVETWETCRQLLPHVPECVTLINQWHIETRESIDLLNGAGTYLLNRAEYSNAQRYYEKALSIAQKMFGKGHVRTTAYLDNLALVYQGQGKYELAASLHEQALAIRRKVLGDAHPDTATSLNNLALVYQAQGKYGLALSLHEQALAIKRMVLGNEHPDTATSLGNLALVYQGQGKYELAASLHEQALAIRRKVLGNEHPDTAASLGNLAVVYQDQGKYELAINLHEQSLAIRRKVLGDEHPETAASLSNLALIYQDQGKYGLAINLHEQALAIDRKVLGDEHPDTAKTLGNLALIYQDQGKYELAISLHEQALAIERKVLGSEHPDTAKNLNNLAETYLAQKKYEQAENLHEQALAILQKAFGDEHHLVATSLNNRGELFLAQGRYEEAKDFFQRALVIQQKVWDELHPDTARTLHNLGRLARAQGLYDEAFAFFQRALAMRRARLGEEHPKTQETLASYEEMAADLNVTEG